MTQSTIVPMRAQPISVLTSPLGELAELHALASRGDLDAAPRAVENALKLLERLAEPYYRAA